MFNLVLKIPSDQFDLDFGDEGTVITSTLRTTATTTEGSNDAVSDEEIEEEMDEFLPYVASFSKVTLSFKT